MATDYLYLNPTFLMGAARVADFWGSLNEYNTSRTAAEADLLALESDIRAIASDWKSVGTDLEASLAEVAQQLEETSDSLAVAAAEVAESTRAARIATDLAHHPQAPEASLEYIEELVRAVMKEMAKLESTEHEADVEEDTRAVLTKSTGKQ